MTTRTLIAAAALCAAALGGQADLTPIIYCTDLYHPHQDPDDHYDLATLFALDEFDIRAIILDVGAIGREHAGAVPLEQMMHLCQRNAPYATGLEANLASFDDACEDRPAAELGAVNLILDTLEAAEAPLTIFATGSLRDVAAAFNRAPDLFKAKTARLYVNAGHSDGGEEYNVKLDPKAYVRILRSGLPVYWAPCFGKPGFNTYWHATQSALLEGTGQGLQNFILYALEKADPAERDPIAALGGPLPRAAKDAFYPEKRNMWCTAPFLHAAGRTQGPFAFVPLYVHVADDGTTTLPEGEEGLVLHTFRKTAAVAYQAFLTGRLHGILVDMPLAPPYDAPPAEPEPEPSGGAQE